MEEARRIAEGWAWRPTISVVMVTRDPELVAEAVASVSGQVYQNWQLCIAIDESRASRILPEIQKLAPDARVSRTVVSGAGAPRAARALATGDYVTILEENAVLAPLALYRVVEALQTEEYELIYSDEDSLDPALGRVDPLFKPAWSPELSLSELYPGNLLVYKSGGLDKVGDVTAVNTRDFVRSLVRGASKRATRAHHIPRILCHSRTARRSESAMLFSEYHDAASGAIARAPARQNTTAIVCSRSAALLERCLASIRTTAGDAIRQVVVVAHEETGPNPGLRRAIDRSGAVLVPYGGRFDFASMNNLAVERATEPNLLFLNDDVYARRKGWAEMLADRVTREEIGIAGAVLWYPEGILQHAGITVGISDGVGHTGRNMKQTKLWPWLSMTRNVSAVTGACLAIRASLFRQMGGFDREFPNNYNDIDLCFRVRREGYEIVCVPVPGLIHDECQSRPGVVRFQERYAFYRRWSETLSRPDPYYSPSLTPTEHIALNLDQDDWYRPLLT